MFLHLLHLTNIDILRKGIYQIRVKLKKDTENKSNFGIVSTSEPFKITYQREKIRLKQDQIFEFHSDIADEYVIKVYLEFKEKEDLKQFKRVGKAKIHSSCKSREYHRLEFRGDFASYLSLVISNEFTTSTQLRLDGISELKREWKKWDRSTFNGHCMFSSQPSHERPLGELMVIPDEWTVDDCTDEEYPNFFIQRQQPETRLSTVLDSSCSSISSSSSTTSTTTDTTDTTTTKVHGEVDHLIFCVSGLDATHQDFRRLSNLAKLTTTFKWHLCKSNNGRTFGNIMDSAHRLLEETRSILKHQDNQHIKRTSFICHSMGALVVRAMISLLDPDTIEDKTYLLSLDTYVSLAGPHLGLRYLDNFPLESIMKSYMFIKGSEAITQLMENDKEDNEEDGCFLSCLARSKAFGYFQNVDFYASPQDFYVPFHSALAEIDNRALKDEKHGNVYLRNLVNLSVETRGRKRRIGVIFKRMNESSAMDTYLKREAHIRFLTDTSFLRSMLRLSFPSNQ